MQRSLLRQALFSGRTFAAAMLALYIAFWLDLERPYWAMLTVYIVAQPLSGMVRSKSLYRVIGTVTGAVVTVALLPLLVNAPVLLTLAFALWIALCLYRSLLDPTPRSYAFILAGYTTALIGFPSVDDPGGIFMTALARVEEITLGIICMTVLSELVLPERTAPLVERRLDAWFADARTTAHSLLTGATTTADGVRLARTLAEIETLRFHAVHENPTVAATTSSFVLLQRDMQAIMPILSGIAERLRDLRGPDLDPIRPLLDQAAGFFARHGAPSDRLLASLRERQKAGQPTDWETTTRLGVIALLRQLVESWDNCRDLRREMAAGARVVRDDEVVLEHAPDHRLAAMSALAAFVAILVCSAFWIATAWPEGFVAVEMAGVLCCLFARAEDPAPAISSFLRWGYGGAAIAGLYLFGILPAIDGFVMLTLVLAPLYLLLGIGIANPRWMPIALALTVNSIAPLALGPVFTADFGSFVNGVLAQQLGIWVALTTTRLLRSLGAEQANRRLLRAARLELAQLAGGHAAHDSLWLEGRVLGRLGALGTRLDVAATTAALIELRAGANILALRRADPTLSPEASRPIRAVLARLAREFRRATDAPPSQNLRARIDLAFRRALGGPAEIPLALAGLRRALFPDSPPPGPGPAAPADTPDHRPLAA